jgi:hypothetical protein
VSIKAPAPNDLVRDCLHYLRVVRRIFAFRNNSGATKVGNRFVRFGEPGSPDILGILQGGRMLCVEAKTGKGRLSASQGAWLALAREAGALVIVARSVTELDDLLGEAGYGKVLS